MATYLRLVMAVLTAAALICPLPQGPAAHAEWMPLSAQMAMPHDVGLGHGSSTAALERCMQHCLAYVAILPSAPVLPAMALEGAAYAMPILSYARFDLHEPPGRPPKPVLS